MTLAALIAQLAPVLEGGTAPLPAEVDADRFAIYVRFCAAHRKEALRHVFARTFAALGTGADAAAERYFQAYPMRCVELNENGEHFPEFLAGEAPELAELAELADFEWWEWRTFSQRLALAQETGLRIAPSVELRSYARNYCEDDAPAGRTTIVFWRDHAQRVRREPATLAELEVLRAVHAGRVSPASETLDDLLAAGILTQAT